MIQSLKSSGYGPTIRLLEERLHLKEKGELCKLNAMPQIGIGTSISVREALKVIAAQAQNALHYQVEEMTTTPLSGQNNLFLRSIKNRNHPVPFKEPKIDDGDGCALCKVPSVMVSANYRGKFRIVSNRFRYGHESLMILPHKHIHQGELRVGFHDYLRLVQDLPDDYTYFFNGLSGNSQSHLHLQALKESLPLRQVIESGQLPLQAVPLRNLSQVRVGIVDGSPHQMGHLNGIMCQGSPKQVDKVAKAIIQDMDQRLGQGSYNMILWKNDHDPEAPVSCFIIPKSKTGPSVKFGALAHAGLIIDTKAQISLEDYSDVTQLLSDEIYFYSKEDLEKILARNP